MRALYNRGIVRSANSPVGDYCERIVARHLGAELVANSTAGYDLLTKDGQRVQVKGRRLTPKSRPSHFSPLRGLDDSRHFDVLIAVLLEEDFQVAGAWQATWATVQSVARWRKRLNGHLLYLTDVQKDPRFERLALG